jgi:hypothetical protein
MPDPFALGPSFIVQKVLHANARSFFFASWEALQRFNACKIFKQYNFITVEYAFDSAGAVLRKDVETNS